MARARGLGVRARLTLSYAGFLLVAGVLLLAVVWLFLLRYVPDGAITTGGGFVPNRSDLVRAFVPRAAVALLGLLGFGLLGGWILAGRVLAPLTRITEATRIAADGTLSHRIGLPGRSDEFRELADAFDAMLARLEAHVDEQQRFAANASHELRTPLAITQTLLEVARRDPDRDRADDLDQLHRLNTRAIALTESLLLLSRAGHTTLLSEPVDLSLLAEEAAETLLPIAEAHGVRLDVVGTPAHTRGEPALIRQLVINLLHNAIVHNLPSGGTIAVSTTHDTRTASLMIENTGAVLDPGRVVALTEPFQRGSDRVRDGSHVGVGLGLAIADRIVDAHAGTLTLTARDGGGLRVHVGLPVTSGAGQSQD